MGTQRKFGLGRLFSLGTKEEGLEHWWSSRLTSVLLIPFMILFLILFIPLIGAPLETVKDALSSPIKGVVMIIFILLTTKHLEEGNQVIIEDYVHDTGLRATILSTNKRLIWAIGLIGAFAIALIMMGL